jgi:DNA/RNA endonuclease YhcR with UshA esterase domain
MLKKRTILWIGIPLLLLVAAAWGYYLYVEPHRSAADKTVDFVISADSLYQQYQANEHSADQKYLGKIIEVSGKLAEIQHSGNSEIWILSPQAGGGGINCQLFGGTKIDPEPKSGDVVTVKGRCTGFLMDVNLADCVLRK